jgi:hypothetical protein
MGTTKSFGYGEGAGCGVLIGRLRPHSEGADYFGTTKSFGYGEGAGRGVP